MGPSNLLRLGIADSKMRCGPRRARRDPQSGLRSLERSRARPYDGVPLVLLLPLFFDHVKDEELPIHAPVVKRKLYPVE